MKQVGYYKGMRFWVYIPADSLAIFIHPTTGKTEMRDMFTASSASRWLNECLAECGLTKNDLYFVDE